VGYIQQGVPREAMLGRHIAQYTLGSYARKAYSPVYTPGYTMVGSIVPYIHPGIPWWV